MERGEAARREEKRRLLQSGAAAELTAMRDKGETWETIWRLELQSDEILCSKDFCWCSLGGSRGGSEENDLRDKQGGQKCPRGALLRALSPLLSSL